MRKFSHFDEPSIEIVEDDEIQPNTLNHNIEQKLKSSAVIASHKYLYNIKFSLMNSSILSNFKSRNHVQGKSLMIPMRDQSPLSNINKLSGRRERTAKKKFNSENNPHDLIRCAQKEKYVWYSTYDEEMQISKFKEIIKMCNDQSDPIVIF